MRVMVPPEGMGVAGVKASVTGTGNLQATRSDDAMLKDTDVTGRLWINGKTVLGVLNQIECSLTLFQVPPRSRQLIFKSACDAEALLQEIKIRSHISLPNVHSGPVKVHE